MRILVRGTWSPPDVLGVRGFSGKRPTVVPSPQDKKCVDILPETLSQIATKKAELRKKLRFRRDQFVKNMSDQEQMLMFRTLPSIAVEKVETFTSIGAYVAMGSEADILPMLKNSQIGRGSVALPWFENRSSKMLFRQWDFQAPLSSGPFGILQPDEIVPIVEPDMLFMPLLGFDRHLNRIGQGGGHYDKYLDGKHVSKIGIGWSIQEIDRVPTEPTDIPLDAILTQSEWIIPE